jgi:hypothetical protein
MVVLLPLADHVVKSNGVLLVNQLVFNHCDLVVKFRTFASDLIKLVQRYVVNADWSGASGADVDGVLEEEGSVVDD